MQQIQYFKSAWGDIQNSPGWFGKLCLLALINFIPVFGQIVTYGYLYGWAREIAWGTHEPMPARIFSNEDGKLYRRGWFILVLVFVAGLVPAIVMQVGTSMQGIGFVGAANGAHAAGSSIVSGLGVLVSVVGVVGGILLGILAWIGSMRISIYDRLSAGFQIGKIWKMFRHDTNGAMRIFGMVLLFGLIFSVVLSVVYTMIFVIIVLAGFAGLAASGYNLSAVQYMTDSQAAAMVLQFIASAGLIGFIGVILLLFVTYLVSMFVELLVARAIGYWTMQFDVPRWRGQDDPMPFELAASAAAAAPTSPAPMQNQAPYGAYGAYGQQPVQNTAPVAPSAEPAVPYWQSGQAEQPVQEPFANQYAQAVAEPAVAPAEFAQPAVESAAEPIEPAQPVAEPAVAAEEPDVEPEAVAEEPSVEPEAVSEEPAQPVAEPEAAPEEAAGEGASEEE